MATNEPHSVSAGTSSSEESFEVLFFVEENRDLFGLSSSEVSVDENFENREHVRAEGVESGIKMGILKEVNSAAASPNTSGSASPIEISNSNANDTTEEQRGKRVFQFKITLSYMKPTIWRRIQLSSGSTFRDLHEAIISSMGWAGYHLHKFQINGVTIGGLPAEALQFLHNIEGTIPGKFVNIREMFEVGQRCLYEYDFGDCWRHRVRLEKILPAQENQIYPKCVGGKRACPPEDCGGVPGYENLLLTWAKPENERTQDEREELKHFGMEDPAAFDVSQAYVNTSWTGRGVPLTCAHVKAYTWAQVRRVPRVYVKGIDPPKFLEGPRTITAYEVLMYDLRSISKMSVNVGMIIVSSIAMKISKESIQESNFV